MTRRRKPKMIQQEFELGLELAEACAAHAEQTTNFNVEEAKQLVIEKLRAAGGEPVSGEDLVDWCRERGQVPHIDAAFGNVFASLSREKLIEKAGYGPRRKGHAAHGAARWRIPA